jgi:hypothetical protein
VTDVLVERTFDPALRDEELRAVSRAVGKCLDLHRVRWRASFLARDRRRMLCHFEAPDAEAVRNVFRLAGTAVAGLWAVTVHGASDFLASGSSAEEADGGVLEQVAFAAPVTSSQLRALARAHSEPYERSGARGRTLLGAYVSRDRSRAVFLYRARDVEPIGDSRSAADVLVGRVWAYRRIAGCLPLAR